MEVDPTGGKHERQNPRGSPDGALGPGDKRAIELFGKKGQHKTGRRKSPRPHKLDRQKAKPTVVLSTDENQVLYYLLCHGHTEHARLPWPDIARELELMGIKEADMHPFLERLESKVPDWLTYTPHLEIYLELDHLSEVNEHIKKAFASEDD
jgi:hypothetical protein